jgi:hypothetical protein
MIIEEKLNSAVKMSQYYILLLLKELSTPEQIASVENLFNAYPVVLQQINSENNEFGKSTKVGGITNYDKIVINLEDVRHTNLDVEFEVNKLIGAIIHEYAHKIRAINNEYGEMFEESFASIFAELCVNNAKLKIKEDDLKNNSNNYLFQMSTSINYQNFESQVRAILYILKQKNLDKKMIVEYVAGNQELFKQICMQEFSSDFITYYNYITSKNTGATEQILIDLLMRYIKSGNLSINDYWGGNKNQISTTNLYFQGSPTLAKAVVSAGIGYIREDEKDLYKYFESSAKIANENENLIDNEKINRIKSYIITKFDLVGKTPIEIYDILIDLCSSYIQHKNREDEESKIFITELTKMMPDIDSFNTKFISLRVSGLDNHIFDNLVLGNINYSDIATNMDNLLQEIKDTGFRR